MGPLFLDERLCAGTETVSDLIAQRKSAGLPYKAKLLNSRSALCFMNIADLEVKLRITRDDGIVVLIYKR
jgi:hypothetical protein